MIQRIQTLYLLMVFILVALLAIQNPIYAEFSIKNHNNTITYMYLKYLSQVNTGMDLIQPLISYKYINLVCLMLVGGSSFYAIFLYKNRTEQMKVVIVSLIASIVTLSMLVVDYYITKSSLSVGVIGATLNPHALWMVMAFLLNLFALKGIREDHEKVSSRDSIR